MPETSSTPPPHEPPVPDRADDQAELGVTAPSPALQATEASPPMASGDAADEVVPGSEAAAQAQAQTEAEAESDDAAEPPAEAPAPAAADAALTAEAAPGAPVPPPQAPAIAELSPAACAALLAEHFPALFGVGRPLPIKLRIQADIQQRTPGLFSKKSLSIFLHRHTTSTAYIKALLNAPHRFDLDGQAAGDIAQEHRDAAVAEIERRLAIVQARRVAERDAQRQAGNARRPAAAAGAAATAATDAVPADATTPGAADGPPEAGLRSARPPRADRGERSPQPDRAPRGDRPLRPEAGARPERGPDPRPPRPPRLPHAAHPEGPRGASAGGPAQAAEASAQRPARTEPREAAASTAPSLPLTPEQIAENEARRARAALLRTFESSTLTRSNFCALKGMTDAALEAQMVQAREERKLAPLSPDRDRERDRPPHAHRDGGPRGDTRGDSRGDTRGDSRGPRRDGPPARPGSPRPGPGPQGRPPR